MSHEPYPLTIIQSIL